MLLLLLENIFFLLFPIIPRVPSFLSSILWSGILNARWLIGRIQRNVPKIDKVASDIGKKKEKKANP